MQERPRVLALDVGDRRVGVAVSDAFGMTAQPVLTLGRKGLRQDLKSIGRILRKHAVAEVVAGNPLHMSGEVSPQAAKAQAFAEAVRQEFGVPVHLWDERLTSAEAHELLDSLGHPRGPGRRAIIDQVAAVIILQSFLNDRASRESAARLAADLGTGQAVEEGARVLSEADESSEPFS